MSDEEYDREKLASLPVLELPTFNPVQFNISANSNEFTVVCGTTKTLIDDGRIAPIIKTSWDFILKLSAPSAKDLLINLSNMVMQYEEAYGKIETDLLRRMGSSDEQE